MIKVLDSTKKNFNFYFDSIIKRRKNRTKNISSIVRKIIDDVKKNGDKALLKYEKRYNSNSSIIPNPKKIKKAIAKLDPKVKRAIDVATERIFKWHSLQKVKNINFTDKLGNNLKYRYLPIDTACVYVPGSSVSYPSSLLMGAIPAIVAGCKRIILLNPGRNGVHNSAVLYAAHKLKIKVFSCGGSAAIAAAAFGTKKIPKVDLIVGPGSDWVTLAKKEVSDVVGIDGLHGPSEILIVADKYCNPEWIASDLLAQSEHSNDAMSILLSKNKNFIEKVKVSIVNQLKTLERKSIIKKSLKTNGMLVYTPSDKKIIEVANKVGPEHLSISTKNYKKIVPKIKNAGSIACGPMAIMAMTDYLSSSNHILPTEGRSYYSSGLSVFDFYKKTSIINHSKLGVDKLGNHAYKLAKFEMLDSHAKSIKLRMRRK
tara:strand:+ start:825 stop:2105 length:1281 start_codon:yes stop_codon:yes gene_type:complete